VTGTPTVSVVIPTYNRLARLQRVLGALVHQTYPRELFEVVVVSDGSTDGTDDYLRTEPPMDLVFVAQSNSGPAVARNHGIEMATGSIVLFIDDDVIAAPQLIEQHLVSHDRGGDGLAVVGPMLTPADFDMCAWVRWEQTMLYRQYDAMVNGVYEPTPRQFYTGNASVGRATLLAAGGFDSRFRRAEDLELAYRLDKAGVRFVFNPEAVGYHYADRPFRSWLRNAHEYGVCDAVFARDHRRDDVLDIVREGFQRRSALVRWTTYACLAQPRFRSVLQALFKGGYEVSEVAHAKRVARVALSGMYNIAYYQGLADELGGEQAFRRVVVGARSERP
jgi:glycosyltransferase involved in cell wall biosynthesis